MGWDYKNYKDKDNLREHERSQHSDIMYPCDQCDYKAPLPTGLKDHKELKHGKDKNFVTNVTIKHLYISTLELTRNHMKIIDLHAVNVTIKLEKVQTVRNKMVHGKVRFKCEFCDHNAATQYLI